MSLYVALKAAVPLLNALPKETYSTLARMAAEMNPDVRRSLTGMLQSGLSEEETKSLTASVKRIDGKHKG